MVARFLETAPLDCAAEIDVDRVDLLDEDVEDEDVELLEEEDDVDELAKDEDALDEAEAEDTDTEVGRTAVPVVCMYRSTELDIGFRQCWSRLAHMFKSKQSNNLPRSGLRRVNNW